MRTFKVLAVGDVVSPLGVDYLAGGRLRRLRDQLSADFVIVNGENSAEKNGINSSSAEDILMSGADVITGGNHSFKKNSVYNYLDSHDNVLRPANYPSELPGTGAVVVEAQGLRVLVFNICGTTFMEPVNPPFSTADRILQKYSGKYDISVLDFHAEATSEKLCIGRWLDGRINVVFGTHTHVQTADAQILPKGTGYITDLGMTGPMGGVLGVKTENIFHKFTTHLPTTFEIADGPVEGHGALFSLEEKDGKFTCVKAEAINF